MQLIEPDGRRVRLTPAGRRLADHAVTILAAVDSARLDLDPDAEPAGTVRVGGFATGIRISLLPIVAELAQRYPRVDFVISEYEPIEAFALLTNDDLDLALTYGYQHRHRPRRARCWRRCRCGQWRGDSASRPTPPTGLPTSPRMPTGRGLSTPATRLTKTPSVLPRQWPGSPRGRTSDGRPGTGGGSDRRRATASACSRSGDQAGQQGCQGSPGSPTRSRSSRRTPGDAPGPGDMAAATCGSGSTAAAAGHHAARARRGHGRFPDPDGIRRLAGTGQVGLRGIVDHRWAQVGHCMWTSVPWLLSRYCQWVLHFRRPAQAWQLAPWSQLGHGNHARRPRSAVGSIGNTSHRPIGQHTGADQLVVDPLLLVIEIGVQHVVRLLFFGKHRDGIQVRLRWPPVRRSVAAPRPESGRMQSRGRPTDIPAHPACKVR